MANKTEHGLLGALIGLATYTLCRIGKGENPTIQGTIGSLLLGGFAGVLPDILEPATNPNHRSFFHSIALLMMLIQGNQKAWQSQNLTEDQKLIISIISAAYGSYIVSDSRTPKSIPFII